VAIKVWHDATDPDELASSPPGVGLDAEAGRDEGRPRHRAMAERKRIALIAHDNCKRDLLAWARYNHSTLQGHELIATGSTGSLLKRELGLQVECYLSGPLGGDQQVGAAIAEGRIDAVIFFWDPLQPHPHDVDVKALLRIAVVYNVPTACNRATADFMLSSPLLSQTYQCLLPPLPEQA
jgi:methylglyoxal synthase